MTDLIANALENVEYRIECLPEDCQIEGNAMASGDDDVDSEVNEDVRRQLDNGNEWAWCTVRVVASLGDVEGDAYLGCCSYASEKDFATEDSYYPDMKSEALADLVSKLESIIKSVPTDMLRAEMESRGIDLD